MQYKCLMIILLFYVAGISCYKVKVSFINHLRQYSINIPTSALENSTWHPPVNRPYLKENSYVLNEKKPINYYATSLIQIQRSTFLKQKNRKLQCGCRFVKDQSEPDFKPLYNYASQYQPQPQPQPQPQFIPQYYQPQQTPNLVTQTAITSITTKIQENNNLIASLQNLVQAGSLNNNFYQPTPQPVLQPPNQYIQSTSSSPNGFLNPAYTMNGLPQMPLSSQGYQIRGMKSPFPNQSNIS